MSVETSLLDLAMDSLTLVSVLAQVEAVYDFELTPEDTVQLFEATVVRDLVQRLEKIIAVTSAEAI